MKVQTKITLAILGLIIFFGTIACITTYYLSKANSTNQATTFLLNNSLVQGDETYQVMRQSANLASMLSSSQTVKAYFDSSSKASKESLTPEYLNGYNLGNMYLAIYILNDQGLAVVSTDPRFKDEDNSFREYFAKAMDGNHVSFTALGITSNELGYYFSAPIYSPVDPSKINGVTVFKLNPAYVESTISDHLAPNIEVMLTDQYGVIIAASDKDRDFHSLATLSKDSLSTIENSQIYSNQLLSPLNYNVLMEQVRAGDPTPRVYQVSDKFDGAEEILSIHKLKDFPFYLIFEGNEKDITQSSLRSTIIIAAFVGAAALSCLIVILFLVRHFIRQQENSEQKLQTRTLELQKLNDLMVGRELKMVELKKQLADAQGSK